MQRSTEDFHPCDLAQSINDSSPYPRAGDEDLVSEVSSLATISLILTLSRKDEKAQEDDDFSEISSLFHESAFPLEEVQLMDGANAEEDIDDFLFWEEEAEDWEILSGVDEECSSYETSLRLTRHDMMRQGGLTYLTEDYYQNPFDKSMNGISSAVPSCGSAHNRKSNAVKFLHTFFQ